MPTYHEFDKAQIDASLKSAAAHYDHGTLKSAGANGSIVDSGHMTIAAAMCISVTVEEGKVCLNLPLGINQVCLPIPSWISNGTVAKACLELCTRWGIPTGVEVTVSVGGAVVVRKSWGAC